jgi:hypothetical protein
MIGLEGGDLHHNGTHWRSLLISRKDRVPNRNMRTIRRLCAASLIGSIFGGQLAPDAEPGRLHRPVRRWSRSPGAELCRSSPLPPMR